MRILLDECVTKHFKKHLATFEVQTVREMGWGGLKNGELMKACVESRFNIVLTIDKNLQFQQNLDKYPLAIVVSNSKNSKLEALLEFLPEFLNEVENFEPHKAYVLSIAS
jgi:hypothetical protein